MLDGSTCSGSGVKASARSGRCSASPPPRRRSTGRSIDDVHFHEVGAIDAIADVVGSSAALDYLDAAVVVSPLPLGKGMTRAAHGTLPLPAPATVECLVGLATYDAGIDFELVTPTGAGGDRRRPRGALEALARRWRPSASAGARGAPTSPTARTCSGRCSAQPRDRRRMPRLRRESRTPSSRRTSTTRRASSWRAGSIFSSRPGPSTCGPRPSR